MNTRRPLTQVEQAESARLKAIYEQRKAEAKATGKKRLNQLDVALACGWAGQSAFSQYATGKVPLNVSALMKIARALDFDPALVSARLMDEVSTAIPVKALASPGVEQEEKGQAVVLSRIKAWDDDTPLEDDEVRVPFLREVELAAGSGRFVIEESETSYLRFDKRDLRRNHVQFDQARCVTIRGNSMMPVLKDGATVGVNIGKNSIGDIVDGDLYALNHNGQLRVKQLYRLPSGLRLRSFNRDEHPDEDYSFKAVAEESIVILGHVFWWGMFSR